MPGIVRQHARQPLVGLVRAVGHDDHAGVQRIADADAAAVMDGHPRGARGGVEQRVQHRPVGDRVAAVAHAFGLPIRRRHRAGVEMIAPDDDGRADDAATDQVVERQAEPRALAVAEPEDARGQALERDALARQPNPAAERLVGSEHLERQRVGGGQIRRIARKDGPPERTLALAEQRAHVLGNEPGNVERARDAGLLGLRADVVAVVERHRAARRQVEHRLHVRGHRRHRPRDVRLGILRSQRVGRRDRQARRGRSR